MSNKYKVLFRSLLAFASQVAIFAVIMISGQLHYATNDDTTIIALAGGGYGSPSEYVINFHMILGYILKWLYTICVEVNWITVLFIIVYFLGIIVLDIILAQKVFSNGGYFGVAILLDIAFFIVISHFTFTIVAYWAGMVGLIAVTYANRKKSRGILALGIVLLITCALIRGEAFKSLLIIYIPLALFGYLFKKNFRNIVIAGMIAILMFVASISHTWLFTRDPIQKDFLEWGETRSAALDCRMVPWDEAKFTEKGITYNEYLAIYNAFYYCYDTVDTDTMNAIIELNDYGNKYNLDIVAFLKQHFNVSWHFETVYRALFAIVLIGILIISNKNGRLMSLFIWLAAIGADLVFFIINRSPYRVIMPGYLFATLLLLIFVPVNGDSIRVWQLRGVSLKKIFILCSLLLGFFSAYQRVNKYIGYMPWLYGQERKAVLQYMENHQDTIFLAGNTSAFSLPVAQSIWEHPGQKGYYNFIGNWETYSLPYLEMMKDYGIQDPYNVLFEAINNDNILLLVSEGDGFAESHQWIVQLAKECYDVDVCLEKVEDISQNEVGEFWCVYKLVS